MAYEKSLIIFKPDTLQRGLSGAVLSRFENAGFKIHATKMVQATPELAKKHYAEHAEKAFFPTIEKYITSGPALVLVLGGHNAIKKIRLMVGATEPASALPGTIRGDYAHQAYPGQGEPDDKAIQNLIHASASAEEAETEIAIWFAQNEVLDYSKISDTILF